MRPPGTARRGGIAGASVAVLLLASAAAYAGLLQVQRALFLNGVPPDDPFTYPRPGADLAAAAAELARYWPLTGAVTVLYLATLLVVRAARTPLAGRLAIGAGILGQLALLPTRPGLSIDLLSYLAHGYLANERYASPYASPAANVIDSPLGPALVAQGWTPVHPQTPYGPLWTHLERLALAWAGGDIDVAQLLLKVGVTAASIGTGVLALRVADVVRPGSGRLAAATWLLNPIVVVEFAVDGHNDALPIFLTAVALFAALRGWAAPAVVALGLGTLTKYTPALFGPVVLWMLVRNIRSKVRLLGELVVGGVVSAVLAWLLWRRWWTGPSTLDGLRISTTPFPAWSPAGWLASTFGDPTAAEPSLLPQLVLAVGLVLVALRPTLPALLQVTVLTAGSRIAGPWGNASALGLLPFEDAVRISSLWGVTVPVALCGLIALTGWAVQRWRRPPAGAATASGAP